MRNPASPKPEYPVFYDPRGRRAPLVKTALALAAAALAGLAAAALWSLFSHPVLPALPPPPEGVALAGPGDLPPPAAAPLAPAPEGAMDAPPPDPARPLAFAFLINWDPAGLHSLRRHAEAIDVLIPQWLYIAPDDLTLIEEDPEALARVEEPLGGNRLRIMPMVVNLRKGEWKGPDFAAVLARPGNRRRLIDQLVDYCEDHEFLGLSVDFEQLPAEGLPGYYAFVEELADGLHRLERKLSVNVPFEDAHLDYGRLAAAADYLIVMAYDEHWAGGEPGSIAGAPWLARRVEAFREAVPAGRLVLGLGNYALDWSERGPPAAVRSVESALSLAARLQARVGADPLSLNPAFRYEGPEGAAHQVWFMDAVTAFNAARLFVPARPAGYALWRLGLEDPSLWEWLGRSRSPDVSTARHLTRIEPQQVVYEGSGEVLRLESRPRPGARRLWQDPRTGLLTERFERLPLSTLNRCYGGRGKRIALTFDDGPDPAFTPAILSILRDHGVKATFFIVGFNGRRHPALLRREWEEGHEIGIHTFSHPDIAALPAAGLAAELAACQNVLERELGRRSVLFRPPYGRDLLTADPALAGPLAQVANAGYLTVGMRLDTADWTSPDVGDMVRSVLGQAEEGGRILVMHDAGGDRRATLEALPALIARLRERGYEFVTVSRLLGLDRAAVMPPLTAQESVRAEAGALSLSVLGGALAFIKFIFLTGLALGLFRMVLIGGGALVQRRRARRRGALPLPPLSLSVIIPAHNEGRVVVQTVRALLASEGVRPFEILVVDDGSRDDTYARTAEAFAGEPRVRVFTKPNGGKSSALNFGLSRSASDVVIMLDADTLFRPDAIRRLLAHFSDPAVGAVAGNVKVGNRVNLLTRWQALEYITSQSLDRRALTVINCNNVVPGAIGAWRRDLVVKAGMLNPRTLAEDGDLTLSICRMGYRIEYEDAALALTEAPDTMDGFLRQRFRWMFGTFQVAARHLPALFNRSHPWLGFVGMPNLLLFQVFFPLLAPFMDLVVVGSAGAIGYAHWRQTGADTMGLRQFILYYLLFLSADTLSASLAFLLEPKEDRRLLAWVPVQRVFYRMMMYVIATKAVFSALSGHAVGWGSIARKATVPSQAPVPVDPQPLVEVLQRPAGPAAPVSQRAPAPRRRGKVRAYDPATR